MHPLDVRLIIATLIYALLGGCMLVGMFWVVDKIVPTDIWRQLVEEKNLALAIVVAAFVIAIGIIVAAAVD
jgi:uncharacterized membrane protein YjfL (UPF0719 family)